MCGFVFYSGIKEVDVKGALSVINHRGPDSTKIVEFDHRRLTSGLNENLKISSKLRITLGFNRLAIIDLSKGSDQPFSDESGKYHIIFNGEIYNYLELKQELIQSGVVFRTNSDTEVLLKSYIHWGRDCLRKFNGMWSFVIIDLNEGELFVSRDRFGVKPLYYFIKGDSFSFFSEIKQAFMLGFKKELNTIPVRGLLESSILDTDNETFYKGIFKFPASHFALIKLNENVREIKPVRFYDIPDYVNKEIDYSSACNKFRELLISSIELRFRSDVTVGACLSGGLDSSSISSIAGLLGKSMVTLSVDNERKGYSEYGYVKNVLDKYPKIENRQIFNNEEDLDLINQILCFQDEPIAGFGVIAQWKIMDLAKRNGIIVLLDGQGGDEILGGYRKYVYIYLKELINNGKIRLALSEASKFLNQNDFKLFEREGIRRYLNMSGVSGFLTKEVLPNDSKSKQQIRRAKGFNQVSYADIYKYSFPPLLRYEDRNSMAFSIESRLPFLDYRIIDFLYSLPSGFKIRDGYTKAILRDSLTGILPDEVRLRKSKFGFTVPEEYWIKVLHYRHLRDHFKSMNNPFLNSAKILNDFEKKNSRLDFASFIRLYLFDRWFSLNFN